MRDFTKAHWEGVAIAGAVVLGAALRCWQIRYNFDGDEIFSVSLASGSFVETISRSLADTPHPPLHNILLHAWISLFGPSEPAVRALSVLFSCGFIVLAYKLMRRYADPWCAFAVALLAALSPLFIYFGQQARPYALIAFLAAANLYAFLRAIEAPDPKWPVRLWALSGVALVYSQYVGVLFIGGQLAWAIVRHKSDRRRLFGYGMAAMGSLGFWAAAAMGAKAAHGANPLPQITWMGAPTVNDLAWFYVQTFGAPFSMRWLFALLAIPAIAYGRFVYRTHWIPKEHQLLLLLAFGLPLLAYAISVWGSHPIFVARQLEGAALVTLLVVGLGATELPVWAGRAVLVALIAWSALSARQALPDRTNPPWRETAQWIEQHYGAEMLVAEENFCSQAMEFYRRTGRVPLWPALSKEVRSQNFLFACRPMRCALAKNELAGRAKLVKTWQWKRFAGDAPPNRLELYTVRAEIR